MRNDARPMGERLRDKQLHQDRGSGAATAERAQDTRERKPFVTDRDTGDEESPPPKDGSTLSTKL
jgi:hypothetical protein